MLEKNDYDNVGSVYSRGGLYFLGWLILMEVTFILLIAPPSMIRSTIIHDLELSKTYMSESFYEKNKSWTDETFDEYVNKTGMRKALYRFFVPSAAERKRSKGMENIDRGWWDRYIASRLDALFYMMYLLLFRFSNILLWLPFMAILAVPALLDGYYMRKKKQSSFDYTSPVIQQYALRIISWITVGFVLYLFLPFSMHPMAIPAGFTFIALLLGLSVSHLPKRI